MKKFAREHLVINVLFVLLFSVLFVSCTSDTKVADSGEITTEGVKSVMVSDAPLSTVRPAENELSEEEVLLKVAKYVVDKGYYNKEYASSVNKRLVSSKIETPIFTYCDFEDSNEIGYYTIYAVDDEGNAVVELGCSGDVSCGEDSFTGALGSYEGDFEKGECVHEITQREARELFSEQFPDKEFTTPEMISIKNNNSWGYIQYWYVATVDKNGQEEGFSRALQNNPVAEVEEYIMGTYVEGSVLSGSRSLSLASVQSSEDWGGIMKLTEPAGFYKTILANKTIFDASTNSSKGIAENSIFDEYRGKKLTSVHSMTGIKSTPVTLN